MGKQLACNIAKSFEESMNNDLDVKTAFDELSETVSKLSGLMKEIKLSTEIANAAVSGLHETDSVLGMIF